MADIIPIEIITEKIFELRGQKILIDADLAKLYNVPTKRLNESVKRNIKRFPEDLMFRLTFQEKDELVAICDRFANLKHSSALPQAIQSILTPVTPITPKKSMGFSPPEKQPPAPIDPH